jgi:hypothetical protein
MRGCLSWPLERFQAKWTPVRVKKTRQIKNLERRFDSIEAEKALAATGTSLCKLSAPASPELGPFLLSNEAPGAPEVGKTGTVLKSFPNPRMPLNSALEAAFLRVSPRRRVYRSAGRALGARDQLCLFRESLRARFWSPFRRKTRWLCVRRKHVHPRRDRGTICRRSR